MKAKFLSNILCSPDSMRELDAATQLQTQVTGETNQKPFFKENIQEYLNFLFAEF